MLYVQVPGTDSQYARIAEGVERTDDSDGPMSQRLLESVVRDIPDNNIAHLEMAHAARSAALA